MPPIYVDLDATLSYPVYTDATKAQVLKFVFRPGALEFLRALSGYGELVLLTASENGWAEDALSYRKDLRRFFSQLITREQMASAEDQLVSVLSLEGVSDAEKLDYVRLIPPIAPPGVVFDDQPYGSNVWFLKSVCVGIYAMGRDVWIQVPAFSRERPDMGGLERAFHRFRHRNVRDKNSMELAGRAGYNSVTAF